LHYLPPPTDGQTEVTNRTLTSLLGSMVSKSLRDWISSLLMPNSITIELFPMLPLILPFEVCYDLNPLAPIDPIHIP